MQLFAAETLFSDPVARIFARGLHGCVMCMQARLGGGGVFLEIRCSEIASEAILGQKQHRSSSVRYMAHGVLYPIFGCPCMHLLSQLTSSFHERRYYG